MMVKTTLQWPDSTFAVICNMREHLFMESHTTDRAQLPDEVCNYLLWLTPSHHEIAVKHTHKINTETHI